MDRTEKLINPKTTGQGVKTQEYPSEEFMTAGHLACPGCGAAMAMRLALKALGNETIVIIPACCWAVIPGPFPYTNLKLPLMHTAFETTAAAAAGVRAALDIQGKDNIQVMGWAGDGGTFDIGIQALSAAAERNENIIYVCYDNEAYMNTGIQRSSATPLYAWTTTTPNEDPKIVPKKSMGKIMAAHNIPYVATTTPALPHDLIAKFKKAKDIKGTRFLHILCSCNTGWKVKSEKSVEIMRLAVESKIFPIYEIFDGEQTVINVEPKGIPVKEYLTRQGRFKHLTNAQMEDIQKHVDHEWEMLKKSAG